MPDRIQLRRVKGRDTISGPEQLFVYWWHGFVTVSDRPPPEGGPYLTYRREDDLGAPVLLELANA